MFVCVREVEDSTDLSPLPIFHVLTAMSSVQRRSQCLLLVATEMFGAQASSLLQAYFLFCGSRLIVNIYSRTAYSNTSPSLSGNMSFNPYNLLTRETFS